MPLEEVFDPTGAGDTFAGGFMGSLAASGKIDDAAIARAIIYGSTLASFAVEDFSLDRLLTLTQGEIKERFRHFKRLTHFDESLGLVACIGTVCTDRKTECYQNGSTVDSYEKLRDYIELGPRPGRSPRWRGSALWAGAGASGARLGAGSRGRLGHDQLRGLGAKRVSPGTTGRHGLGRRLGAAAGSAAGRGSTAGPDSGGGPAGGASRRSGRRQRPQRRPVLDGALGGLLGSGRLVGASALGYSTTSLPPLRVIVVFWMWASTMDLRLSSVSPASLRSMSSTLP